MVEHHHTSEFFACVIELNVLTASDTGKGRSSAPHLSLAQSQCCVGEMNPQRVLLVMEVVVEMRSKKQDGGANEGKASGTSAKLRFHFVPMKPRLASGS